MRRRALIACAALCLVLTGASALQRGGKEPTATEIPTVSFCDLVRNPKLYDGKVVRVSAFYRIGFEWSQMYCADCAERDESTWVEYEDEGEMCRGSKEPKDNRTSSVVFVGKFYGSGGRYGHLKAYKFKFVVSCVEKSKTVLKNSYHPLALRDSYPEDFKRVHCAADTPKPQARGPRD